LKHLVDGTSLYSPRDLVAYLEGDFAAWCERDLAERSSAEAKGATSPPSFVPDDDPERALAARMGREYEARYLSQLRLREPLLVEIARGDAAAAETLAAMRSAAPAIYQAHLSVDGWQGYPDFLFRCAGPGLLGDHHYNPWDTKLARSAKPYFLVQLCAYAEMLEAIQGVRPVELVFVLGNGEERHFVTRDFFYYYRQLKRDFLTFQKGWDAGRVPHPGLDRSWGRWTTAAQGLLERSDHLSRVANISRGQIRRLEEQGITTLSALAACDSRRIPHVSEPVFERLRVQARLQSDRLETGLIGWRFRPAEPGEPRRGLALLPPPSPGDIYFDMEGFPFAPGGLEYLFGAVTLDGEVPQFHDWWAHDEVEQRHAFEAFIDWAYACWRQEPSLHIYHYAAYETTAVKRLMGKYATREAQVDDLLRHDVFVDLYAVVRQGLVIGTPSYSLKEIERLYLPPRQGDVISAGGSVIEY